MDDEKKEKGFVIKDKRFFDESGEARPEELKKEETAGDSKSEQKSPERDDQAGTQEEYFPEVTFSNFVLSLSTTVMYHLGDFPDPATNKAERNLAAAKQTIDMLNMIKIKTAGNLDIDEKALLEGILYELMIRYVKEKEAG
jgi:hypothetical protein